MHGAKLVTCASAVLLVIFVLSGCSSDVKSSEPSKDKDTTTSTTLPPISQGVNVAILLRSGGCMPTTDREGNTCSVESYDQPTTVVVKQPVDPNVFDERKVVVATVENVVGTTNIELPAGKYNLYVMFQGEEYCNRGGGQLGQDCEFQVFENRVTDYELTINIATD